jgi:two-component system response regulator NreC
MRLISLKTVETHRAHINRKLGVHSTAQLIRLAALRGLLPMPSDGATGAAPAKVGLA